MRGPELDRNRLEAVLARAKRTRDRADARRRYRQAQLEDETDLDEPSAPATAAPAAAGGKPARPSFRAAFRVAFHRANVREDLPYIPALLRHWSFWVPLLLMIGSGVAFVVAPKNPIVGYAFQTFVLYPPPLIVMFIAGFFAKRASYLLGGFLGAVNILELIALRAYLVSAGLEGVELTPAELATFDSVVASSLLASIPVGIMAASLAAYYKRFLNITNPNRGRRPPPKGKPKASGRPVTGR